MIKTRTFVAILAAVSFGLGTYLLMSRHPEPALPSEERFPIVSRFELPRDYGYFIGDEIPLTLIIETHGRVVLDLVNLPQKGEKHGLFEIRGLSLSLPTSNNEHKVYRASYVLQYFGATPLTAQFQGLEILYALSDARSGPHDTYAYKSLFTQPVTINVSRIGPFRPAHAMGVKGPQQIHRQELIFASYIFGTAFLCLVLGTWLRACRRQVQYESASPQDAPTVADTTLQTLKQEGVFLLPSEEPAIPLVSRLSQLLRQYFRDAHGIPAFTSTATELAPYLPDEPLYEELLLLLERCEDLKHQPPEASQMEERQLWWEAIMLFEKIQKDRAS